MRVLVLASGGKDSTFAHWWALMQGWEVAGLVTARVHGDDSWMFQREATLVAAAQAALAGVAWRPVRVSGEAEVEVDELEAGLAPLCPAGWGGEDPLAALAAAGSGGVASVGRTAWSPEVDAYAAWPPSVDLDRRPALLLAADLEGPVDAVVSGALASDYQRTRLDRLGARLGVRTFAPLWHHDRRAHLAHMLHLGFDVRVAATAADGLDAAWLGRPLDEEALQDLTGRSQAHRFDLAGEGGEFETVVLAGPHLRGRIEVEADVEASASRSRWRVKGLSLMGGDGRRLAGATASTSAS